MIFVLPGYASTQNGHTAGPGLRSRRAFITRDLTGSDEGRLDCSFEIVPAASQSLETAIFVKMDGHSSHDQDGRLTVGDIASAEEAHPRENVKEQGDLDLEDSKHRHEANTAFLANSRLTAVSPQQSIWTGLNPLAGNIEADWSKTFASQAPQLQSHDETLSMPDDTEWQPSLAIGSINTDRLGAREAARRYMVQWDHIWDYNRVHNPGSLHIVDEQRARARTVYEDICARDNADDSVPKQVAQAFQEERIAARVAVLRQALDEADADLRGTEHMRKNIKSALDGYISGALGFSNTYALVYAGRIVDTSCTLYAEFTEDRQDRLDRYFAQYGPGYLWWEPPLAKGSDRVSVKKGTVLGLDREEDLFCHQHVGGTKFRDDSCHFQISLGFQKDDGLRCRRQARFQHADAARLKRKWEYIQDAGSPTKRPFKKHAGSTNANTKQAKEEPSGGKRPTLLTSREAAADVTSSTRAESVKEEDTGPVMFFDMLLDSGAEIPILLHDDFGLLGYTKDDMNAATVVELNAAAGQNSMALCFELLVGLDLPESAPGDEPQSQRHFFPTRVVKLSPAIQPPPSGGYSGDRLSGILPFLAYYMSSAPGRDKICMGDERVDVLGMDKMPAGLRYHPFRKQEVVAQRTQDLVRQTGPPKELREITFEHEVSDGMTLIDRDIVPRGSLGARTSLTLVGADGKITASWPMWSGHQNKGKWKRVGRR